MADDFDFALAHIADESQPSRSLNLTSFSDLSRNQLEVFRAAWDDLTPERRLELIQAMVEQAEANIHLNFHAILRGLLSDADPRVRRWAIEGLWEDERPSLAPILLALLSGDADPDVRAVAASSLGRFVLLGALGDIEPSLSAEVEQALRVAWARPDEAVEVRRRALEGLAYSEDLRVRNLIETAYYDEDETMRQSALFAMGRTADARWSSFVMAELANTSASMRFEAAVAAGELRLAATIRALVRLMDDPDGNVREAAALALGKIGGKEAQRALRLAARGKDSRLAEAAGEALEELSFDADVTGDDVLMTYPSPDGDLHRRAGERLDDADYLATDWEAEIDDEEDGIESDEDDFGSSSSDDLHSPYGDLHSPYGDLRSPYGDLRRVGDYDADGIEEDDDEGNDAWDDDEDAEALIWEEDEEEDGELDDWDDRES